jgi:geranylgeranyl reductase family protein
MTKILIIGAGPIGCYAARLLKERNFDIELIEEHPEIGRPVHCAGLVSREVLSEMKVPLDGNVVLNYIDGAEFFFDHDSFRLERKGIALIIDREKFDHALGRGLNVHFSTRFMGLEKEGTGYLVETDKGEFHADIVIGADGANSSVRKIAAFKEEIEYLRGVQFRISYNNGNKNFVQVYLKHPFFAWIIPEDNKTVRAGIISRNPYHDLIELLKERFIEGEILEKFAGIVPLGWSQSQQENLFLLGDAACQIKPMTHGGIYYGMRCAEILADCISQNKPDEYERAWKDRFAREISIGIKIRRLYEKLNHDDAEEIFAILKDNVSLIEEFGDFENHSRIISLIVRNPRLQVILGKVLINIFKGND